MHKFCSALQFIKRNWTAYLGDAFFISGIIILLLLPIGENLGLLGKKANAGTQLRYAVIHPPGQTFSIYNKNGKLLFKGASDIEAGDVHVQKDSYKIEGIFFRVKGKRCFMVGDSFRIEPEPPHGQMNNLQFFTVPKKGPRKGPR